MDRDDLAEFKKDLLDNKPKLENRDNVGYNKYIKSDTVSIQSLVDATVKITGIVTGQQYVFHGAGDIQRVNIQDKDEILDKKRGRSCCGGVSGKSLFVLV